MARKTRIESSNVEGNGDAQQRGKRKPRQYRFETVDEDGVVNVVSLTLTHKQSAKDTLLYLNDLAKVNGLGATYRFTEVILYQ